MASAASDSLEQAILRRALNAGDGRGLHLRFSGAVLDRYREQSSARLIRTETVGRINVPGSWSFDVGIGTAADGSVVLHATFGDLLDRLPERERDHWVAHLVPQPASTNFFQMRMAAGACIDDGEPRAWD